MSHRARWIVCDCKTGKPLAVAPASASKAWIKRQAQAIATRLGKAVRVAREGARLANPAPDPARGQIWRHIATSAPVEVRGVNGIKVSWYNRRTGDSDTWSRDRFKEEHRPPAGLKPNPKGRKGEMTAMRGRLRAYTDATVDSIAHNGKTRAIRDAAKRELVRRGVTWSGAGVAERAMRGNPGCPWCGDSRPLVRGYCPTCGKTRAQAKADVARFFKSHPPGREANPVGRPHTIRGAIAMLLEHAKRPDLAMDVLAGGDPIAALKAAHDAIEPLAPGGPRFGYTAASLRKAAEMVRKLKPGQLDMRVNPAEYAFEGTLRALESAPERAPLKIVTGRRSRASSSAPRAQRAPAAPRLEYGDHVRAPYSGPAHAFGRTITKTSETGQVVGLEDRDGEPWVRVFVKRGRGRGNETWHPARSVRKVRRYLKDMRPISEKHPRLYAKAVREIGGDLDAGQVLVDRALEDHDMAAARARQLDPSSPDGRRAYAKVKQLERWHFTLDRALSAARNAAGLEEEPWRQANPRPFARTAGERQRAERAFQMWHEFSSSKVKPVKVHSRTMPKHLVELGQVLRIDYRSNKWEGKPVDYTHATKRPYPLLVTDPDAQQLYLVGGKMKPTADGLVN